MSNICAQCGRQKLIINYTAAAPTLTSLTVTSSCPETVFIAPFAANANGTATHPYIPAIQFCTCLPDPKSEESTMRATFTNHLKEQEA